MENKLKTALEEIINPIKFMQERLKEGERLNGGMAIQIAKDPHHYKSIAEKALYEYDGSELSDFADWLHNNWFKPIGTDGEWCQDLTHPEYQKTIEDVPIGNLYSDELVKIFLDGKGTF